MGQLFIFLFDEEWEKLLFILDHQNVEESEELDDITRKIRSQTGLI